MTQVECICCMLGYVVAACLLDVRRQSNRSDSNMTRQAESYGWQMYGGEVCFNYIAVQKFM